MIVIILCNIIVIIICLYVYYAYLCTYDALTCLIFTIHREPELSSMFYVIDARRQIAAVANNFSGKGTEDVSEYPSTEIIFCDIENIHVMRASFASLLTISMPKDIVSNMFSVAPGTVGGNLAAGFSALGQAPGTAQVTSSSTSAGTDTSDDTWYLTNLVDSGWIRHVSQILSAGVTAAEKLHLSGR